MWTHLWKISEIFIKLYNKTNLRVPMLEPVPDVVGKIKHRKGQVVAIKDVVPSFQ